MLFLVGLATLAIHVVLCADPSPTFIELGQASPEESDKPPAWYVKFKRAQPDATITPAKRSIYKIVNYDMTSHLLNNSSLPIMEQVSQRVSQGYLALQWTAAVILVVLLMILIVAHRFRKRFGFGKIIEERIEEEEDQNYIWSSRQRDV